MKKHLHFVLKYTLILVILLGILALIGCSQGSPYPEDMWTKNIYPGTPDTYNVGSATYPYHEGHFGELFLNGHLFTSGVVSSTWVVAASNSRDVYRADLRCDGVDDDLTIQTALNNLPANGGRVILLEGTYNTAANIQVSANTTVEGQGYSTVISANSATITNAVVITGSNASIKNLKVVIIAGCGAVGSRPNLIRAIGQSRILLENLYLYGDRTVGSDGSISRQNGIYFVNIDYSKIVNCETVNNEYYGIRLDTDSDYNNIEKNISTGNGYDGLILDTSDYNSVLSGIYNSNDEQGIHVKSADNNRIEDCTCTINTRSGIYALAASGNSYINNTLKDNVKHGLQLDGVATYNIVEGNLVIGNDSGATGLYSGIYILAVSYTTIVGNSCYDNGLHGIYLLRSCYCAINGNICMQQTIGDGIRIVGDATLNSDNNTAVGNVCYNNGGDGVEIEGDASGGNTYAIKNIVTSNQLSGNGGVSLNDDGTSTQIDNNII